MSPRPNVETERRQQILEAAMICFSRKGYHQTKMSEIAAELPFSKGLLYYYFETKRDLFLAILDNWLETTRSAWEVMLSSESDATTQLRTCAEYGMQLIAQYKDLARVEFEFYGELGRDETISEAYKNLFAEFRAEFTSIINAGIASGEFRPVNAEALSAVLLGMYEGLAMQALVDPVAVDWPLVGEELFNMVMQGITPTDRK